MRFPQCNRFSNFAQSPCLPLTHLVSKFTDKGKSVVDNRRVPNSGSQSASSASSIDKPSLVYQLQKMNGMEKKRRSKTRRDQQTADRPGQPYQKGNFHARATSSTAQPESLDLSDRSSSRRKDTSRISKGETFPFYFNTFPPTTLPDEHRSLYPSATSPSRSSSPSYYLSAGTSPSLGSRNLSPLRASLPVPSPTFDHFQQTIIASRSTPDSFSPTSPGYHDFQCYSHELPGELRAQHPVSRAIPIKGSHSATQLNDIHGPNHSCWNEYNGQHGRIESSVYPRSLASHRSDVPAQLAHQPEQTSATSSFPPILHGLGTPPTGNPSGSYFCPGYEDRATVQNAHLLSDRSPDMDSPTTIPYYS